MVNAMGEISHSPLRSTSYSIMGDVFFIIIDNQSDYENAR